MNNWSLKIKFSITIAVVFVSFLLLIGFSFKGLMNYQNSTNLLFDAVQRASDIAKIKEELSSIRNNVSLTIIDGLKREVPNDPQKTALVLWIKKDNTVMPKKESDEIIAMWKEYLEKANAISKDFVKTDQTLDEYLSTSHEDVYRKIVGFEKTGTPQNIDSINLYENLKKGMTNNSTDEQQILEPVKAAFDAASEAEKNGSITVAKYQEILSAIETAKDALLDISDKNEKHIEIFKNRMNAIYSDITARFQKIEAAELHDLQERRKELDFTKTAVTNLLIIIAIISLVLVIVVILWLLRSTVNPIVIMKDKLSELSERGGDLTVSIPVFSNDEIGEMTRSLNNFLANLRDIIGRVKRIAGDLNGLSAAISSGTNDASAKVSETSSYADAISQNLSEISKQLDATRKSMDDINKVVMAVSKKSDASSKILDQALGSMQEIKDASAKIQNVIEVVNEIAFQTNLLSLNAAIEAARAGEYGKGFAVVAGEVRALSQRSSEAAQQIKNLINNSSEKIEVGAELVGNSSKVFLEIISEFRNIFQQLETLAVEIKANAEGVAQVDRAVDNIRETINSNAAFIEETAATSQEMFNSSNELNKDVEKFTV